MEDELRELCAAPISIVAGTRDGQMTPHFARAMGMRFWRRDELALVLPEVWCDDLIADIRENGRVAVTAINMLTFKARQLKGRDAQVAEVTELDIAAVLSTRDQTLPIARQFYGEEVARNLIERPPQPFVVITFHLDAVFDQTPYTGTGAQIG